jgi:hypothetical protein
MQDRAPDSKVNRDEHQERAQLGEESSHPPGEPVDQKIPENSNGADTEIDVSVLEDDRIDLTGVDHSSFARIAYEVEHQRLPTQIVSNIWGALFRSYHSGLGNDIDSTTDFARALEDASRVRGGTRLGDLMVLPDRATVYFFSDCEGAYHALLDFIQENWIEVRLKHGEHAPPVHLVFNGDSIDRSRTSHLLLSLIIELDKRFPGHIHVSLGNHELDYTQQQNSERGFFHEILAIPLVVSEQEWTALLTTPEIGVVFREYIRGDDNPSWKISANSREILYREYKDARTERRREIHRSQKDEEDFDLDTAASDASIIVRKAREQFVRYFIWDLYQLWFSSLPTMVVSNQLFCAHGFCPISGPFDPESLQKKERTPLELLQILAQGGGDTEEICWTDLDIEKTKKSGVEPASSDGDTVPELLLISDKPERGKGLKQATEPVAHLFLRSIFRRDTPCKSIFIRGHQHLGSQGYHVEGCVHTIQSSPYGGSALKVELSDPDSAPVVERLDFGG